MTVDPYMAGRFEVMQVSKNIHATLVSTFLDGKPQGLVARDWEVDAAGRVWRFHIRPGLSFEDGSPLTAEAVARNLRRILWLTRGEGLSLNALLPEVSGWKSIDEPLRSLYVEGDAVVFKFSRRPANLFETLGHPIYGIADPKCFDAQGRWREPFCPSASGQYRVRERTPARLVLGSRHVFPEVQGAPDVVEILVPVPGGAVSSNPLLDGRADLSIEPRFTLSPETLREIDARGLAIMEEPAVDMYYVQLNASRPPFSDRRLRQAVREDFLRCLRSDPDFTARTEISPSFFPKGGIGYLPFEVPPAPATHRSWRGKVGVVFYPLAGYPFPSDRRMQEAIEGAVVGALRRQGLEPEVRSYSERGEVFRRIAKGDYDVMLRWTGILVNDPFSDLRMMLLSQVGAMVPDTRRRFPRLLAEAEASADPAARQRSAETINQDIFDGASVITYAHSGFVFIHRRGVDLSRINPFSDPIEFRAVGWHPSPEGG